MLAGILEIQMAANIANLQKDMAAARSTVDSSMQSIGSAVNVAKGLFAALGVTMSAGMFVNFIRDTAAAQDELAKMSQRVGVSVESLAGLEFAASMSGSSIGSVEKGLKQLSTQLVDADRGLSSATSNFGLLGISVYDTNGALKSADQIMVEVAGKFAAMEDGTLKTAAATKLFGRAGLELIPMLNEGADGLAALIAEGQRYNPVTAQSAAEAEVFNDNMERMERALKTTGIAFVNNILPALAMTSDKVVAFINDSDQMESVLEDVQLITEMAAAAIGMKLAASLGLAAAEMNVAAVGAGALRIALGLLASPTGIVVIAAAAFYALVQAQKENAEEAWKQVEANDALRASIATLTEGELARELQAQFERTESLKRSIEQLTAASDGTAAFEDKIRRLNAELMESQGMHSELRGQLDRVQGGMRNAEESTADATEEFYSLIDGVGRLGTSVVTAGEYAEFMGEATDDVGRSAREAAQEIEEFIKWMDAGAISASNSGAAYVDLMGAQETVTTRTTRLTEEQREQNLVNADAQASIDEIVESLYTQEDAMKELGMVMLNLRDDMSSAFADMMMDGGNAFDSIAKSFERMIYKMVADLMASELFNLMGQLLNIGSLQLGGSANPGSILGTILRGGGGGTPAATGGGGVLGTVSSGVSTANSLLNGGGIAGGVMAGIAGAGSVFGTTGAVISAAEYGMLTGGATVGAGGSAGAGIAAGLKGLGTGAMNVLQAIPGWGWALGGLAVAAALLDKDPTYSSNAGFLLHDVPGASADRKFDVAPFASGFDPVGFARREDKAKAIEVIDAFRAVDAALTEIYAAAGSPLIPAVHRNIRAFSETGTGSGVYMGLAAEDGKPNGMPLDQQLAYYAAEVVRGSKLGGYFGGEYFDKMDLSGSYQDIIASVANALLGGSDGSNATGLAYVPFDGYRSRNHQGEAILRPEEAKDYRATAPLMERAVVLLQAVTAELADLRHTNRRIADLTEKSDTIGPAPARAVA